MLPAPLAIPESSQPLYRRLRILLWIALVLGGGTFILSILFPTITQTFDFDTPGSSRNTIVEPRDSGNTPLTTGKVSAGIPLIANTSLLGDFSSATLRLTLEADSNLPETVQGTLRRGYRAAFLPLGDPLSAPRQESVFKILDTYYLFENNTLRPFISEAAYRSRFDTSQPVTEADPAFLDRSPVADAPLGFRIGSLLSFADGVFVVTSPTEIRPIGSAEILLALGYRFQNVLPVSEEELGIYERGRIILLNTAHPEGTLFRDLDTNEVFMIEKQTRRVIGDEKHRAFLESKQAPIPTRLSHAGEFVSCELASRFFPRTYRCQVLLDPLRDNLGFDYELLLQTGSENFEIERLSLSFDTHVTFENARTLVAKVKQRVLARFGLAPEL